MGENENNKNGLKSEKRLNFILRVLSLLIALILWLYVAGTNDESYKKVINSVPISIFKPDDLSVISGSGITVDVTVSGKKSVLDRISADNITAYVDLSDVDSGGRFSRTVDVTVSGAEGVTIVSKSMDTLSVFLDKTTTVKVPLKVLPTNYKLGSGYSLGEPETDINEITVSGPEAELLSISGARVDVDLDDAYLTKSLNVSAELKLLDEKGDPIGELSPYIEIKGERFVSVNIPVYLTRNVSLYADYKYGYYNNDNVEIRINPSTVKVTGLAEAVEGLDRVRVMTIDEKSIKSDTSATVALNLPNGVKAADGTETVSVGIVNRNTSTKTVICSEYNLIDPQNTGAEIVTEYVGLLLRGKSETLEALTASDIVINVDISSYSHYSGSVRVPVTVEFSGIDGGAVYELGEYSVTVQFN